MKKLAISLLVLVFATTSFACDGSKHKDKSSGGQTTSTQPAKPSN